MRWKAALVRRLKSAALDSAMRASSSNRARSPGSCPWAKVYRCRISKTKLYEEIERGNLRAKKSGTRTLDP